MAPYGRRLFELKAGEWGRFGYIARETSEMTHVYSRLTFNIGLFTARFAPNVFMGKPQYETKVTASLYRAAH